MRLLAATKGAGHEIVAPKALRLGTGRDRAHARVHRLPQRTISHDWAKLPNASAEVVPNVHPGRLSPRHRLSPVVAFFLALLGFRQVAVTGRRLELWAVPDSPVPISVPTPPTGGHLPVGAGGATAGGSIPSSVNNA